MWTVQLLVGDVVILHISMQDMEDVYEARAAEQEVELDE
jgi:hypothetical protein